MGLVDDHHVMLREDTHLGKGVNGEHGVVGDHHIHLLGFAAGLFGEAILTLRAAGRPQAFPRGDADLPPREIRHARVEGIAVAGVGVIRPVG